MSPTRGSLLSPSIFQPVWCDLSYFTFPDPVIPSKPQASSLLTGAFLSHFTKRGGSFVTLLPEITTRTFPQLSFFSSLCERAVLLSNLPARTAKGPGWWPIDLRSWAVNGRMKGQQRTHQLPGCTFKSGACFWVWVPLDADPETRMWLQEILVGGWKRKFSQQRVLYQDSYHSGAWSHGKSWETPSERWENWCNHSPLSTVIGWGLILGLFIPCCFPPAVCRQSGCQCFWNKNLWGTVMQTLTPGSWSGSVHLEWWCPKAPNEAWLLLGSSHRTLVLRLGDASSQRSHSFCEGRQQSRPQEFTKISRNTENLG